MRQRWVIFTAGLFVALRVPSFVEPTWYSDDGTYASIGWALNHGARLYLDVWDNKPPGTYWLVALAVGHLPAAVALPLTASILTAISALCIAVVGRRLGGAAVEAAATISFVAIASLPNLDGNLFNAELCGAACVALALATVLGSASWRSRFAAGALVGAALLFKGVFVADIVVVMAVPAIIATARGERFISVVNARAAATILAGCSLPLTVAALVLAAQGSLGAAFAVLFQSDAAYIATYGSGGIGGLPGALLTTVRIVSPICAGAGLAAVLARRRSAAGAVLAWWLGLDVAAAMVSGRGFPHYVQQAEPVLCLALALAVVTLWPGARRRWTLTVATAAAAALGSQLVLWIPSAEVALASGGQPPGPKNDGVAVGQLSTYYADGYTRLLDPSAAAMFNRLFPTDLARLSATVSTIDLNSMPGDRVFVWGSTPWIYVLSNRLPAGRYVTLNSAYFVDASAQATLLGDLEAHPPTILIVEAKPAPAALVEFLARHQYRQISTGGGGGECWLLPNPARTG